MTDDSTAERNALQESFPQSVLLLCIFHVLQAAWRYLWDSNHGILLKHRPTLFCGIKDMVYSKILDDLNNSYNKILTSSLTNEYSRFKSYIEGLFHRRAEWAICFRNNYLIRGQNTNNISEAGVKIMKDVILERTKAYSSVQLFLFIINDMDAFYEMKILNEAANRPPRYLKKRFLISSKQMKSLEYNKIDTKDSLFMVYNKEKNTKYTVDIDFGICSCPQDNTGKPCKHQIFIIKNLKIDLSLFLPTNEEKIKRLHFIATGNFEVQEGWYGPVSTENINVKSTLQYVKPQIQNITHCQEPKTNNINDEIDSNEFEDYLNQFDEAISKMKSKFMSDKNDFLPGIKCMVNSINKNVNTDSALLSSLMTFGKYGGLDPNTKKVKLVGNKRIGTQPTAQARRTTKIGGGKNLTAGRVPSWKRTAKHAYANKPKRK